MAQVPFLKFSTGARIHQIGLGTWKIKDNIQQVVENGLKAGYRHIDTATAYGNEEGIGRALNKALDSGDLKRDELFVTTKLWNDDHDRVEDALDESLKKLGLNYVDLWLMHWPIAGNKGDHVDPPIKDTWQRMEKMQDAGKVKAIGLSDFSTEKVKDVLSYARIKPVVNQIEIHPFWRNDRNIEFCKSQGIVVTAYSPLGSDDSAEMFDRKDDISIFDNETVQSIAKKLGKSPAQVVLRWGLERGVVLIPKASSVEHLKDNIDILDFSLPKEDFEALSNMTPQKRMLDGSMFCGPDLPYKSPSDIWDGDGF